MDLPHQEAICHGTPKSHGSKQSKTTLFLNAFDFTTPIHSDERLPKAGFSALGSTKTAPPFMSDCFCSAGAHSNIDPSHSNALIIHAGSYASMVAAMNCGGGSPLLDDGSLGVGLNRTHRLITTSRISFQTTP
jgi:hypothetical protein